MNEATFRGAVLAREVVSRDGVAARVHRRLGHVALQLTCVDLPMRLGGWSEAEAVRLLGELEGWDFAVLSAGLERDRLTEWVAWVRERRPLVSHPRAVVLVVLRRAPTDDLRKVGLL